MSQLPNLQAAATATLIQTNGAANTNGTPLDLQTYKGAVTFLLSCGLSTVGVGTIDAANIQDSADNTTYTAVTGGAFTAVTNTANASNIGTQLKSFESRSLARYVRCTLNVSGTNANIPVTVVAIGMKERV